MNDKEYERQLEQVKVGNRFYTFRPECMWWSPSGQAIVSFSIELGHYEIIKKNEKSIRIREIGNNGRDFNRLIDEEHVNQMFFSKKQLKNKIIEESKYALESLKKEIKRYTKFAGEYYYGRAKIEYYKKLNDWAVNNFDDELRLKYNKELLELGKETAKQIDSLKELKE